MKIFYCVVAKGGDYVFLKSSTLDGLNKKISRAAIIQAGLKPKGTDFSESDYMSDKSRVIVAMKVI
jgi:hypothetical protein